MKVKLLNKVKENIIRDKVIDKQIQQILCLDDLWSALLSPFPRKKPQAHRYHIVKTSIANYIGKLGLARPITATFQSVEVRFRKS